MPAASVDPFIWTNNALLGDIPPKYGSNMSKSGLFLRITEATTSHPPERIYRGPFLPLVGSPGSRLFSLDNLPLPQLYPQVDVEVVVKTNDRTQADTGSTC
ncbi:hypothetical protein BC629DRAFT_1597875 [Irpex lacteus]|nr:hypothetical protein BC629DRAFT_1597875 [Irpex lacteus]